MGIHDDMISRESDECTPAHGIMWNNYRLLGRMRLQGHGDLSGRQSQSPRSMKDDVYGNILLSGADGPQHLLAIIDVDVAGQRVCPGSLSLLGGGLE